MSQSETISIGVGAVVFRGDDVLLIKRGKAPFKGEWSIPGGGLEFGERVTDAVIREVREETNIEIKLLGLLDVFDAIAPDDQRQLSHLVLIDYVAEWVAEEPCPGDDAVEAEFVSVETAIARLSWDVTRQAIRRAIEVRDAFGDRP